MLKEKGIETDETESLSKVSDTEDGAPLHEHSKRFVKNKHKIWEKREGRRRSRKQRKRMPRQHLRASSRSDNLDRQAACYRKHAWLKSSSVRSARSPGSLRGSLSEGLLLFLIRQSVSLSSFLFSPPKLEVQPVLERFTFPGTRFLQTPWHYQVMDWVGISVAIAFGSMALLALSEPVAALFLGFAKTCGHSNFERLSLCNWAARVVALDEELIVSRKLILCKAMAVCMVAAFSTVLFLRCSTSIAMKLFRNPDLSDRPQYKIAGSLATNVVAVTGTVAVFCARASETKYQSGSGWLLYELSVVAFFDLLWFLTLRQGFPEMIEFFCSAEPSEIDPELFKYHVALEVLSDIIGVSLMLDFGLVTSGTGLYVINDVPCGAFAILQVLTCFALTWMCRKGTSDAIIKAQHSLTGNSEVSFIPQRLLSSGQRETLDQIVKLPAKEAKLDTASRKASIRSPRADSEKIPQDDRSAAMISSEQTQTIQSQSTVPHDQRADMIALLKERLSFEDRLLEKALQVLLIQAKALCRLTSLSLEQSQGSLNQPAHLSGQERQERGVASTHRNNTKEEAHLMRASRIRTTELHDRNADLLLSIKNCLSRDDITIRRLGELLQEKSTTSTRPSTLSLDQPRIAEPTSTSL